MPLICRRPYGPAILTAPFHFSYRFNLSLGSPLRSGKAEVLTPCAFHHSTASLVFDAKELDPISAR